MSEAQLALWEKNITRLRAEEVLFERAGSLSARELYTAMIAAGHPKKEAAIASARRANEEAKVRDRRGG